MRADSQRIPELDGLRGTAIGLVILFHLSMLLPGIPAPLTRMMLFGWSGVDLFFVLSGFLIGGILIDHRNAAQYYKPFYARRFFRIIPIYATVLAGYGICWVLGGDIRRTLVGNVGPPMPWYAYVTFTNNLWLALHNTMDVYLPVTWSLAVEEQFYLTLPLIVRFVSPRHLPKVIFSITGVVTALRIIGCLSGHLHQNQAYVLPWFRIDSLMIGVICAMIIREKRWRDYFDRNAWVLYGSLAGTGVALFFIGTALPPKTASPATPLMTFGLTLVALLYASMLLLALLRPGHPLAWVMRARPLRFLGKVSYCVYLIHQAILGVAMSTLGDLRPESDALWQWGAALLGLAVIMIVAQLSWTFFESKLLPIGHRVKYSGERKAVPNVVPILSKPAAASEESVAS